VHYLAEAHEWLNRCSTAADIRALTATMRQQAQTLMEYPSQDAHTFGRWLEALAAIHDEEVTAFPMYKAS